MKIFIDGQYYEEQNAKISVFDHGLLYGDGIFEGIRAYNGRVFKLQEHIDRLFASAKAILLTIPMPHAEIRLGNGDVYTVEGTLNEVERNLSDAARSGHARLAWFKERGTAESIGINPAHVAALRGGETSD